MSYAPIVIFGYNRPDNLRRLIRSLRGCAGFAESPVHIFIDGAKTPLDEVLVEATRDYVVSLEDHNIHHTFRSKNFGLRQSIYDGVSEVIAEYGQAIIFEDDLTLAHGALEYFNRALKKYANDERIWSICGYMYDVPQTAKDRNALILPFAHPWGWATWGRAWSKFDITAAPDTETLYSAAFANSFDMNGCYPFTAQLQQSVLGGLNGWYIHWYYTIYKAKGYSIFPPRRLLNNNGLTSGTHGSNLNPFRFFRYKTELMEETIQLPDAIQPDRWFIKHLKKSTEMRMHKFVAKAGMAKRLIKRIIS